MADQPAQPAEHATSASAMRRGPRGGAEDVKAAIFAAARACFARDGYQATTIKAIAAKAGVDTKLVHYYFGTKQALFGTLISQVFTDFGLLQDLFIAARSGRPGGAIYVRQILTLLDTTPEGQVFIGLIRSVGTHAESEQIMLAFVADVLERIVGPQVTPEVEFRSSLVGSQMLGLVFTRYILKNPVMMEASIDDLAEAVGPTLDRYLSAALGLPD